MHRSHTQRALAPLRPAFTLVEVIVVVVIIMLLAALVFVAVGSSIRAARRAADTQFCRSLAMGMDQFKQQAGFNVPLVDDQASGGPIDTTTNLRQNPRVHIRGESAQLADPTGPDQYLRYEIKPQQPRYSIYSLSYYMLGALPKAVDGVDGAGMTAPSADGSFARSGSIIKPFFDLNANTERVVKNRPSNAGGNPAEWYTEIRDRNGNPIRLYRWLPTRHVAGTPASNGHPSIGQHPNDSARIGEVRSYNVPLAVGDPYVDEGIKLRSASWAIVSAGPNGRIDDAQTDSPDNKDNIVVVEGGS